MICYQSRIPLLYWMASLRFLWASYMHALFAPDRSYLSPFVWLGVMLIEVSPVRNSTSSLDCLLDHVYLLGMDASHVFGMHCVISVENLGWSYRTSLFQPMILDSAYCWTNT